MQVQVVERAQQITLQEQEIIRKEKELEAKVKKPAEAEKYKLEKLAEAQRCVPLLSHCLAVSVTYSVHQGIKSWMPFSCSLQLIMEAEAEAESIKVSTPMFLLFFVPFCGQVLHVYFTTIPTVVFKLCYSINVSL